MTDDEKIRELRAQYLAAMHAVQSGIAMRMNFDPGDTTPKHLRVGVNAAMVEHGGLAALLINKGLITRLEYFEAMAEQAEQEKATYERELSEHFGKEITLS